MARLGAIAAIVVALASIAAVVVGGHQDSGRITTAAELRERLHGLESRERVRELLGEPTSREVRPRAEVWDYIHPFEDVTSLRVVFGVRRRVAWYAFSAPS